jgi:hypothetical protein
MIYDQDLCLPFESPTQVGYNACSAYRSFKLESDLPLPFEELNLTKRKPSFKPGVSKYQRQRGPAAAYHRQRGPAMRAHARLPRVKLEFPIEPRSNRNMRRKANVVVQVDCDRTSALQCVRYIENKRVVFAMWSGSDQW